MGAGWFTGKVFPRPADKQRKKRIIVYAPWSPAIASRQQGVFFCITPCAVTLLASLIVHRKAQITNVAKTRCSPVRLRSQPVVGALFSHEGVGMFSWLRAEQLEPHLFEDAGTGGPDFLCTHSGSDPFLVEATSLDSEMVSERSRLRQRLAAPVEVRLVLSLTS
jgi:hypothetical protein